MVDDENRYNLNELTYVADDELFEVRIDSEKRYNVRVVLLALGDSAIKLALGEFNEDGFGPLHGRFRDDRGYGNPEWLKNLSKKFKSNYEIFIDTANAANPIGAHCHLHDPKSHKSIGLRSCLRISENGELYQVCIEEHGKGGGRVEDILGKQKDAIGEITIIQLSRMDQKNWSIPDKKNSIQIFEKERSAYHN